MEFARLQGLDPLMIDELMEYFINGDEELRQLFEYAGELSSCDRSGYCGHTVEAVYGAGAAALDKVNRLLDEGEVLRALQVVGVAQSFIHKVNSRLDKVREELSQNIPPEQLKGAIAIVKAGGARGN